MREVVGIIAEFNPFHNGHAALARTAKERGALVAAVMSGNFVQRGSLAVTDKRIRTKAALLCGVDLVLELPLVYATAPAQRFARGAVEILAATGCVDELIFGSESGDVAYLRLLANATNDLSLPAYMKESLATGMTFAKARELAVSRLVGQEAAAGLSSPNNALAVEYLRAAREIGWNPRVTTIRRLGAAHDGKKPCGEYASAPLLRCHASDFALLGQYIPEPAMEVYTEASAAGLYPANPARLDTAILAHLRRLDRNCLAALPDLSEGLENRLYDSTRKATTLTELETALKTKRYTMARVRRLVLAAFLGITREDSHVAAPYIRVLGFTPGGREILAEMKNNALLPVSQSLARLRGLGGTCERFAALEALATDLYALALPRPPACGYELTASAIFLK